MEGITTDRNRRLGSRKSGGGAIVSKKEAHPVSQGKKTSKFDEQLSVESSYENNDVVPLLLADGSIDTEALQSLQDNVHSMGDVLLRRPGMDNVLAYRDAIQKLLKSIVPHIHKKESFSVLHKEFTPNGKKMTPRKITIIHTINKKLDEVLKMVLRTQTSQMQLMQTMDEIRGLIVDLLQ